MKYFIDTEFDGFGGPLISLALIREDNEALYLVYREKASETWVKENVIPILWKIPSPLPGMAYKVGQQDGAHRIAQFLRGDPRPHIVSDWPDDISYFCKSLITGPGTMVNIPTFTTQVIRVDAYPITVKGAIQHNAYWDAMALKEALTG